MRAGTIQVSAGAGRAAGSMMAGSWSGGGMTPLSGRDECARGGTSFWDFAREREEDAELFGTAGISADGADQAAQAGRVHRGHRPVAARRRWPAPQAAPHGPSGFL